MTIHKVKFQGRKQKIRIVGKDEIIKENFLQHLPYVNIYKTVKTEFSTEEVLNAVSKGGFLKTASAGESTSEHQNRMYIEVIGF